MSKKSTFLRLFILIFTVVLFTQCNVQNIETEPKSTLNAGGSISRPIDEARIEGVIPIYEVKEKTLESLQSFPMPELKFVFESKTISGDELPEDVKYYLNNHWKEAIKFFYNAAFNKPPNAQTGVSRDSAWMKHCFTTEKKLQESYIEAQNGYRKISQTEASDLNAFLNEAAVGLINKVKSL